MRGKQASAAATLEGRPVAVEWVLAFVFSMGGGGLVGGGMGLGGIGSGGGIGGGGPGSGVGSNGSAMTELDKIG
jgi:hypothetical protein